MEHNIKMEEALEELTNAAIAREATMGCPANLIYAKSRLHEAIKVAVDVLSQGHTKACPFP